MGWKEENFIQQKIRCLKCSDVFVQHHVPTFVYLWINYADHGNKGQHDVYRSMSRQK